MENLVEKGVIKVPSKAKIRVIWEDDPNNYTQERQKRIAKYIAEKYGNQNVQVIFKAKKVDTENGEVEMTVADNVMDPVYQKKLFKEWVEWPKKGMLTIDTVIGISENWNGLISYLMVMVIVYPLMN
jgi:hypothetical protein